MARSREQLPDLKFMRQEIPIFDVATALGIKHGGRGVAHCWRVGAHKNADRTPSLSFSHNRAKCFRCDPAPLSTIDLVMTHEECSLRDAVNWLCARFDVPTIEKNRKLLRPERWHPGRVGIAQFPLEYVVRSGFWADLSDAARAILVALFCFTERDSVTISYRALCRYSGKKSRTTIAKVLEYFEDIELIKVTRAKGDDGMRQVGSYQFTTDSAKFSQLLNDRLAHLKREREIERQLQAEARVSTPPAPAPPLPKSTTLFTVVDHPQSARSSRVNRAVGLNSRDSARKPVSNVVDFQSTSESARSSVVNRGSGYSDRKPIVCVGYPPRPLLEEQTQ